MRAALSNTATSWPARASCCAQASPAGPEPITATRLPLRRWAGRRSNHPPAPARRLGARPLGSLLPRRTLVADGHGVVRALAEACPPVGLVMGGLVLDGRRLDVVRPVVVPGREDQVAARAAGIALVASDEAPPQLLVALRQAVRDVVQAMRV